MKLNLFLPFVAVLALLLFALAARLDLTSRSAAFGC